MESDDPKELDKAYMKEYDLTEGQLAEVKESFKLYDKNDENMILADDLGNAIRSMGQNPTEAEIREIQADAEVSENGTVCMDEYIRLVGSRGVKSEIEMEDQLAEALRVWDKDGNGQISAEDLKTALRTLGEPVDDEDISEMMKLVEIDSKGNIGYYELCQKLVTK